jgi:hypothetical protein
MELSRVTYGRMTLSRMRLGRAAFGRMTLSRMRLSMSNIYQNATRQSNILFQNDIKKNGTQHFS